MKRRHNPYNIITQVIQEQVDDLEFELGVQMSSYGPIPKSKKQAAEVIKKIFNSSKQPFYNVGDDILLDVDLKKHKDKIRFYEYFNSFRDEKEGRGFNFEGMLAGLLNGTPIVSKAKEDIIVNGMGYSVKTAEPGSSFDSGTLIYGFRNELKDMVDDGIDITGIDTPYQLLKKSGEEYNQYKIGMLSSMFTTSNGQQLDWIFSEILPDRIEYTVWSSDALIEAIVSDTNMIGVGRSPKTDVRIKSRFVMQNPSIIKFPEFTAQELKKSRYVKDRGLKVDKIAELFGKYKTKVRYDVLEYIRKNPKTFLKRIVNLYGDKLTPILKEKGLIDLNESKLSNIEIQEQLIDILLEHKPKLTEKLNVNINEDYGISDTDPEQGHYGHVFSDNLPIEIDNKLYVLSNKLGGITHRNVSKFVKNVTTEELSVLEGLLKSFPSTMEELLYYSGNFDELKNSKEYNRITNFIVGVGGKKKLNEDSDIFGQGLLEPVEWGEYESEEEWEKAVANVEPLPDEEEFEYEQGETDPEKGFVAPSRDVTDNICKVKGFCKAQGPITFGQLKALVEGATNKRIASDIGRGVFKTLWRITPFFLPQLLLAAAGVTVTRAFNKIISPALKDTKGYKSWWGKAVMKAMDVAEGDYIPDLALGDDPISKIFFISDGLLQMVKDKYKLKFARYVAEVAESKPDNEPVPEWFVDNLLRDYLNQKFLLDPPLPIKGGVGTKTLKESKEVNPALRVGDEVLVVDVDTTLFGGRRTVGRASDEIPKLYKPYTVIATKWRQPENHESEGSRYYELRELGLSDKEVLGRMLAGGGRVRPQTLYKEDSWVFNKGINEQKLDLDDRQPNRKGGGKGKNKTDGDMFEPMNYDHATPQENDNLRKNKEFIPEDDKFESTIEKSILRWLDGEYEVITNKYGSKNLINRRSGERTSPSEVARIINSIWDYDKAFQIVTTLYGNDKIVKEQEDSFRSQHSGMNNNSDLNVDKEAFISYLDKYEYDQLVEDLKPLLLCILKSQTEEFRYERNMCSFEIQSRLGILDAKLVRIGLMDEPEGVYPYIYENWVENIFKEFDEALYLTYSGGIGVDGEVSTIHLEENTITESKYTNPKLELGDVVELLYMDDKWSPVPPLTRGVVMGFEPQPGDFKDKILVKWIIDSEKNEFRNTPLLPGADTWRLVKPLNEDIGVDRFEKMMVRAYFNKEGGFGVPPKQFNIVLSPTGKIVDINLSSLTTSRDVPFSIGDMVTLSDLIRFEKDGGYDLRMKGRIRESGEENTLLKENVLEEQEQLKLFNNELQFFDGLEEESVDYVKGRLTPKILEYIFKKWDESGINYDILKPLDLKGWDEELIKTMLLKTYIQNTNTPIPVEHTFDCEDLSDLFDANHNYHSLVEKYLCADDPYDIDFWYDYEWVEHHLDDVDDGNLNIISKILGTTVEEVGNILTSGGETDEEQEKVDSIKDVISRSYSIEYEDAHKRAIYQDIKDKLAAHFEVAGSMVMDDNGKISWVITDDLRNWISDDDWNKAGFFEYSGEDSDMSIEQAMWEHGLSNPKFLFNDIMSDEFEFHSYGEGKRGEELTIDDKYFNGYWYPSINEQYFNEILQDRLYDLETEYDVISENTIALMGGLLRECGMLDEQFLDRHSLFDLLKRTRGKSNSSRQEIFNFLNKLRNSGIINMFQSVDFLWSGKEWLIKWLDLYHPDKLNEPDENIEYLLNNADNVRDILIMVLIDRAEREDKELNVDNVNRDIRPLAEDMVKIWATQH